MLPDVGMPCVPVFEDNQGGAACANFITNSNSKHIDVRYHFLRELVGRKEISIIYVPSPFQHADLLTEAIPRDSFEFHHSLATNLWCIAFSGVLKR